MHNTISNMRIHITSLFILVNLFSRAQFTDITNSTGIILTGNTQQSGSGVSFFDFDHDSDDDLTFGGPFEPIVAWRNDNGTLVPAHFFENTGDPKSVMWIDYDNDGDSDLFFSVYNQSAKLYRNEGADVFVNVTDSLHLPAINARTFGCAWGDFDNDGYLDVYLSNFNVLPTGPTNWLLRNTGNGGFTNVTASMGVSNGTKRTYQSSWIDFNLDGWLDLFVANDLNDGNELYINTGSGFIASGAQYGLNTAMEGMSSSWSDFDSDGDFDGYVSNNLPGNKLFRNDGDTTVDIAPVSGTEVNALCWGTIWLDFDHDGFDDLHIGTTMPGLNNNQNYLLRNNGDYTFSDTSMTNDLQYVYGSAKGDINNDGWWDFIEMKMLPAAIGLWQNIGGTNHWLKFHLQGVASNRDGVGSILRYYYPGKSGMLQTYCGEGYMGQDSQHEIISMADHETLDSLFIQWPSGWVDKYYNLSSDTAYTFIEGSTYYPEIIAEELSICDNDSVMLSVSLPGEVQWFDGSSEPTIWVFEPGTYSMTSESPFGIVAEETIEIMARPIATSYVEILPPSCAGQNDACIVFAAGNETDWTISGLSAFNENCDLTPGIYTIDYIGEEYCYAQETIEILEVDSIQVTASAPLACGGSPVSLSLEVQGINSDYIITMNDGSDPMALAPGSYQGEIITDEGCYGNFALEIVAVPAVSFTVASDTLCSDNTISLTYEITDGTPGFITDWQGNNPMFTAAGEYFAIATDLNNCSDTAYYTIHPFMPFEAINTTSSICPGTTVASTLEIMGGYPPIQIVWGNINTDSLSAGFYPIAISDEAGCVLTMDYSVNEYPELQLETLVTYPVDTLPGMIELLITGGVAPYTYTWNDVMGENNQTWFDSAEFIVVISDSVGCTIMDTIELIITSTTENMFGVNAPYPNPMSDIVQIYLTEVSSIQLLNSHGQIIFSKENAYGMESISTDQLSQGAYYIQLRCNADSKVFRCIKSR
ncbi:MAG: FG-GAP-like repeat-containing protein [Flavobacteriales bacterium]